jgi:hypothetical protein
MVNDRSGPDFFPIGEVFPHRPGNVGEGKVGKGSAGIGAEIIPGTRTGAIGPIGKDPIPELHPPCRIDRMFSGSASRFTITPNHGNTISSDVSSPHATSEAGLGLYGLFAELS